MERYEIRVRGHLSDRRARSLVAIEVERTIDGLTRFVVLVPDQAALHGVIADIRDLGLELLEVRREQGGMADGPRDRD